MKGFWEIFFEQLLSWWWLILAILSSPYLYYLFFMRSNNFSSQQNKNVDDQNDFLNPKTDEEKYLGINIQKSELPKYKKRIEALVELLEKTTGRVSVSAIEAILLVEYFSDDVMVNENGELVIDLKTRDRFCEKIYDDPMAFITYIKAVENKIDIERKENKIEFETILYMIRNAKKFGLYSTGEDTEFTLKIKSAVHRSDYKDVVLNIVEDDVHETSSELVVDDFTLINTNEKFNSLIQQEENKFKHIEKIDGHKVKIITNDDHVIIKDNKQVYSFEKLDNTVETDRINFDINNNNNNHEDFYFFGDAETYRYFLSYLFDSRFSIGIDSYYIFYGERELKNKTIKFLSIDAYYLFSLFYASLKRKHKENFFKYIFCDDFTININN